MKLNFLTEYRGPTKHRKRLKHRKGRQGLQTDVLNTAKNDKGLDNSNPNPSPNLTLILTLIQSVLSFIVMI